MSSRYWNDDSDGDTKAIGKAIGGILALLFLLLVSFYEFVLNPNQNYSVEVRNHDVVVVDGLSCNGQPQHWQFTLEKTWSVRQGKRSVTYGQVLAWRNTLDGPINLERFQISSWEHVTLPVCGSERQGVSFIWSISSWELYMHLRVPPNLRVYTDSELPIPVFR